MESQANKVIQNGEVSNSISSGDSKQHQPPENGKRKEPSRGLYVHEGRMFDEKIYFLNKSTTKFVIVGIEPVNLKPSVCICDRVNGFYITIDGEMIGYFFRKLKAVLSGMVDTDTYQDCGITIKKKGSNYWFMNGDYGVVLHEISVQNLSFIGPILTAAVVKRADESDDYESIINSFKDTTELMSCDAILFWWRSKLDDIVTHTKPYNILVDLIVNSAYLKKLQKYKHLYGNSQ